MPNFNMPEFLKLAIKYGLLDPNANAMDCYMLHGRLLRDGSLLTLRLRFGLKWDKIFAAMTKEQIVELRERLTGVVPFKAT